MCSSGTILDENEKLIMQLWQISHWEEFWTLSLPIKYILIQALNFLLFFSLDLDYYASCLENTLLNDKGFQCGSSGPLATFKFIHFSPLTPYFLKLPLRWGSRSWGMKFSLGGFVISFYQIIASQQEMILFEVKWYFSSEMGPSKYFPKLSKIKIPMNTNKSISFKMFDQMFLETLDLKSSKLKRK